MTLLSAVICWIALGVWAAGHCNAYFLKQYPNLHCRSYFRNQFIFALIWGLTGGPISLLVTCLMHRPFRYGWYLLWRRPLSWRPVKEPLS